MKTELPFFDPNDPEAAEVIGKRERTVADALSLLGLAGAEVTGEGQNDIA